MLEIGTKAPDFELPDQDGRMHTLDEYRGKKIVLYFYPRDNTAGCTKQACAFGDLYPQFTEKGAAVIGISKDSVASHKNFRKNTDCPLLCCRIRSFQPFRRMMSGKKKTCMEKRRWGWSAPLT